MAKNPISIYRIELDVDTHTSQNMIYVKQGDTNREIHMYITEKGKPVDLSNCYAVLKGVKPDGTILFNDTTLIDDNKFVYELTPQTTANAGMFECELTVFDSVDGNKIVTSARFQIYCDKALYNNAIIESRNEYTALTNALASAQNVDVSVSRDEKKHKSDITITDRNGVIHSASVYDGTVIRVETLDLSTAEEGVYFCKNVKYRDIYYPEPFYDLEGNILLKEDNLIVFAYYTGNIDLQEGKEFKVLVIDFNGNILNFNQITKKYETINDANIVENSTKAPTSDAVFKALINKVDKVEGKQLTSNDFTDALKNKLNSIEENANHTVIDNYLSTESTHAVQNGIVTLVLDGKIDKSNGSVYASYIADGAVVESKIARNAITTDKIARNAITTDKIARNAITTDKIADKAINENKLSDEVVEKLNNTITVDSELSETSENPVQNKVVYDALDKYEFKEVLNETITSNIISRTIDRTGRRNIYIELHLSQLQTEAYKINIGYSSSQVIQLTIDGDLLNSADIFVFVSQKFDEATGILTTEYSLAKSKANKNTELSKSGILKTFAVFPTTIRSKFYLMVQRSVTLLETSKFIVSATNK